MVVKERGLFLLLIFDIFDEEEDMRFILTFFLSMKILRAYKMASS